MAGQLLVPALEERAEVLVRRVERIEREWSGLRGMVESASLVPRPAVDAATRRHRLRELGLLADPQDRLTELKQLLRELRDDLDRSNGPGQPDQPDQPDRPAQPGLPGQRPGRGPAERR